MAEAKKTTKKVTAKKVEKVTKDEVVIRENAFRKVIAHEDGSKEVVMKG